jgi:hypothetical protein
VRHYAQRRLADALTHEASSELEFAQLATLKMIVMEQVVKRRSNAGQTREASSEAELYPRRSGAAWTGRSRV